MPFTPGDLSEYESGAYGPEELRQAVANAEVASILNPESSGGSSTEKYDASFAAIRTFSNTTPDADNSVPSSGDFISVNLTNGIDLLEVYPKDLIITNAPSSVVIGVWVKVGVSDPYLLGTFGATPGENRSTVLDNKAFKSLSPIFQELKARSTTDIKVACKVLVDPTRITFAVDNNLSTSSTNNVLGANTGFDNTLCVTNSNNVGLNPGLAGVITFFNPLTDVVTLANASFVTGESLRLPFGTLPGNYIPPLGISGKVICANIDRGTNTFSIIGSAIDFRLLKNRQVRLRISSISSAISVLPSCDGTVLSNATTYTLVNVLGNIGNQTAQLTANGVNPLTFTSQGAGWVYIFPYKDIEGITINGSNQLILDDSVVDFTNDWNAQTISVTTVGTAANILHTGHGFSANEAVIIGGASAPGGSNLGDVFYVIPSDANNYKLSAVSGGLPIAFTGAGTTVTVQKVGTSTIAAVTVTAGTPSVISFGASTTTTTPHWMGALQRFILGGSTRPGAAYTYTNLWISATSLAANSFQSVQRLGSPSVVFETAGTSVTLTALVRFGNLPIERTTVIVDGVDDSTMTIKDIEGNLISMTGLSTATMTIASVNSPVLVSGSVLVRAIKEG